MTGLLCFFISSVYTQLVGFSPGPDESVFFQNDRPTTYAGTRANLILLGENLGEIFFTHSTNECAPLAAPSSTVALDSHVSVSVVFNKTLPHFVCLCGAMQVCLHQGGDLRIGVISKPQPLIPMWANVLLILICLALSALFSGLNLGLMSLNLTELEIFTQCGSAKEKTYAWTIMPVRKHGNYLLCTILFGNVLVMTTVTILLTDAIGSGVLAAICSSFCIVIIGEIFPQAIFSRNALKIGAKTIWLTKIFMVLTFPLSFPVSAVLTWAIGENIGRGYSYEQLMALINIETKRNEDYRNDEMDIINGALQISKKTVGNVMTYIDNVFMLSYDSVLDFETLQKISFMGFTRIPVYRNSVNDIVSILNVKNLMVADPEACLPLRTVCDYYAHEVITVTENTRLDATLKLFINRKSHIAIVIREDMTSPKDVVGLVTLEDVIEEIIQAEIIDETDTIMDNRTMRKREIPKPPVPPNQGSIQIFTPMINAVLLFLRTLPPFADDLISMTILDRLVRKCLTFCGNDPDHYIYQKNKMIERFVIIVSGKLEAIASCDDMHFDIGPFSYFGVTYLTTSTLSVSDFSLRAIGDVYYVMVTRDQYEMAVTATKISRQTHHTD